MSVYRYTFPKQVRRSVIERAVADAIFAGECIYGTTKVRLAMAYYMNKGQCVMDADTEIGEHIAQVFTGLVTRELGEEAVKVERLR